MSPFLPSSRSPTKPMTPPTILCTLVLFSVLPSPILTLSCRLLILPSSSVPLETRSFSFALYSLLIRMISLPSLTSISSCIALTHFFCLSSHASSNIFFVDSNSSLLSFMFFFSILSSCSRSSRDIASSIERRWDNIRPSHSDDMRASFCTRNSLILTASHLVLSAISAAICTTLYLSSSSPSLSRSFKTVSESSFFMAALRTASSEEVVSRLERREARAEVRIGV
mmetsp:Transcript_17784/g.36951  ORF Transcript_17784/g.36951 Transcript_17784/m.36951 type:complete len:226 (-) Transcript_17784:787-1464(-)